MTKKKDFIDPATLSAVGVFTFKAAAQAIIGWLGLEAFRAYRRRFRRWWKDGRSDSKVSSEESQQ